MGGMCAQRPGSVSWLPPLPGCQHVLKKRYMQSSTPLRAAQGRLRHACCPSCAMCSAEMLESSTLEAARGAGRALSDATTPHSVIVYAAATCPLTGDLATYMTAATRAMVASKTTIRSPFSTHCSISAPIVVGAHHYDRALQALERAADERTRTQRTPPVCSRTRRHPTACAHTAPSAARWPPSLPPPPPETWFVTTAGMPKRSAQRLSIAACCASICWRATPVAAL